MIAPFRNVRESSRFRLQADNLGVSAMRLDAALQGVTWAAARDAESLPAVLGTSYRLIATDPFPDLCALRIYVLILDNDTVELDAIECVDDDEDDPDPLL